jgi:hypothetical protein
MAVQKGEGVQGCEEHLKHISYLDGITGYHLPTHELSGRLGS